MIGLLFPRRWHSRQDPEMRRRRATQTGSTLGCRSGGCRFLVLVLGLDATRRQKECRSPWCTVVRMQKLWSENQIQRIRHRSRPWALFHQTWSWNTRTVRHQRSHKIVARLRRQGNATTTSPIRNNADAMMSINLKIEPSRQSREDEPLFTSHDSIPRRESKTIKATVNQ